MSTLNRLLAKLTTTSALDILGKKFFVTGTDTGVGKTTFSCLILDYFAQQGYSTLGLKPIESGCLMTQAGPRGSDTLQLQAHSTLKLPYHAINPFSFLPPTSPNIASHNTLSVQTVYQACQKALSITDCLVIEGAGGWMAPLNKHETMAHLAKAFQLPIVLVVALRLGCLNHALLTLQSIEAFQLPIAGWIANAIPPYDAFLSENKETLRSHIPYPLIIDLTS